MRLVLTFFLLFLVSCNENRGEYVSVIKVGYIPIADCGQLFLADRHGYFEQEGIKVELVKQAGGATILPALAADHVQVGFSNIASVILACSADLPIQPIAGGPVTDRASVEGGILSLKSGEVNGLADLTGRKVAVNTTKNIVHLFVSELLTKNGVDVSGVEFIGMPFPEMYPALLAGSVDAIASIEPFVTFAEEEGKVRNLGDYFTGTMERVQISTYNVLEGGPLSARQVASFRRAIARATEIAKKDRKELVAAIAAYTSLDIDQVSRVGLPTYDSSLHEESISEVSRLLLERKWIKKAFNPSQIMDWE